MINGSSDAGRRTVTPNVAVRLIVNPRYVSFRMRFFFPNTKPHAHKLNNFDNFASGLSHEISANNLSFNVHRVLIILHRK